MKPGHSYVLVLDLILPHKPMEFAQQVSISRPCSTLRTDILPSEIRPSLSGGLRCVSEVEMWYEEIRKLH